MLPLAIATGDPAGVGPVVSARAARLCAGGERLVLFGDAVFLEALLAAEGGPGAVRLDAGDALALAPGTIGVVDAGGCPAAVVAARAPTAEGGRHQLAALDLAIASVRTGRARALVTAPVSKEAIVLGGTPFRGHTEHLARAAGLPDDAVTMMFLGPRLRVAVVTTHLAVRAATAQVTAARVTRTVRHLVEALERLGTGAPRIAVTGLNPHAGEGGLFGDEETREIGPALDALRSGPPFAGGGAVLIGPRAAEAAFREAAAGALDGVVTMLHDQATIPSKLLDWGDAVNVTWGLPFVRTSVDHGVAYDAARTGHIEADGMVAAVRLATRLTGGGRG
jgi:4-hydroxythreonine-4-phosphate dehydrogenase